MSNDKHISDSGFAKWAYYCSFIPVAGVVLYGILSFISLLLVTYGKKSGLHYLQKGLVNVLLISSLSGLLYYYLTYFYIFGSRKCSYESNLDGTYQVQIDYYPNGLPIRKYTYDHGAFTVEYYHKNGLICESNFGVEVDRNSTDYNMLFFNKKFRWRKASGYHENGKIKYDVEYRNGCRYLIYNDKGELIREEIYNSNGQLLREIEYKNGKPVTPLPILPE